jgi:hypothetical protein
MAGTTSKDGEREREIERERERDREREREREKEERPRWGVHCVSYGVRSGSAAPNG